MKTILILLAVITITVLSCRKDIPGPTEPGYCYDCIKWTTVGNSQKYDSTQYRVCNITEKESIQMEQDSSGYIMIDGERISWATDCRRDYSNGCK